MNELDTRFFDERKREWQVRISVPVAHAFCREHRIQLHRFIPAALDSSQLLDLAYLGTRYQARAIANPESKEAFLESLDGPSLFDAEEAAANAVVNFFLSHNPEKITTPLRIELELREKAKDAANATREKLMGVLGSGETFSGSAAPSESTSTEPSTVSES